MQSKVTLFLGTALWGWQVEKTQAFDLLDIYYAAGHRGIDTASNYPINQQPADFQLAEHWLAEWCRTNGIHDLNIIAKLGATNNMGGDAPNLTPSFLLMNADYLQRLFGLNLWCLMLHWDPRAADYAINTTLIACRSWQNSGWQIGLSGIDAPAIYAALAPDLHANWWIEVKHNLLDNHAYQKYSNFHGNKQFIAYGLNAGGLAPHKNYQAGSSAIIRGKNTNVNLQPYVDYLAGLPEAMPARPNDFNQLSMLYAYANPDIGGLIIGPRNQSQLVDSLAYYRLLQMQPKTTFTQYLSGLPLSAGTA